MKKVKTGYLVAVTNRVHGCLEQGGVQGRAVVVPWGSIAGLTPATKLNDPYNDLYSYEDIIHQAAYHPDRFGIKVRVVRRGHKIL
jgi:hypothetical protein